jgi:murein DD-endopeptidase MepM/ murein hydrolase activator NlpD
MKNSNKVITFLKRNAVYIVLVLCVLAIGLSTALLLVNDNGISPDQSVDVIEPDTTPDTPADSIQPDVPDVPVDTPDTTPDTPVVVEKITFIMPVNTSNYTEYTATMAFNSTLNRFTAHKAIDFFAEEGTSVYAVYDGVVESVTNDFLKGYTVTIDHGDGLKTVYNSLADGEGVMEGQRVKKGDVIGSVSITNRQEYKEGPHLHFEVFENDVAIDPIKYLDIVEK